MPTAERWREKLQAMGEDPNDPVTDEQLCRWEGDYPADAFYDMDGEYGMIVRLIAAVRSCRSALSWAEQVIDDEWPCGPTGDRAAWDVFRSVLHGTATSAGRSPGT